MQKKAHKQHAHACRCGKKLAPVHTQCRACESRERQERRKMFAPSGRVAVGMGLSRLSQKDKAARERAEG